MSRVKIEGEISNGDRDMALSWSHINSNLGGDRLIKKLVLTIDIGDIAVLEIEEYVANPTPDQEAMVIKTTHYVNYIDIETIGELESNVEETFDFDAEEMARLVEERKENFISAIDDLEI